MLLLYGVGFVHMAPGRAIPVLPFFNLVMVWNPGVSYGLFPASGPGEPRFWCCFPWRRWPGWAGGCGARTSRSLAVGLGLVIGGALGNLIDRLVYGKVADFFHFYGFGYDWYVFNVADVAITFGVIAIMYDALLKPEVRTGSDGA